jgi:predicted CoA-binding protein
MTKASSLDEFLAGSAFAVAGASKDRSKYGNMVLRCYLQHGYKAYPLHPAVPEIEGLATSPSLAALPETVHGVSIITPPSITESVIDEAIRLGIRHIWIQPGAEHPAAIARAEAAGINVIHGGPCLMVILGFDDDAP